MSKTQDNPPGEEKTLPCIPYDEQERVFGRLNDIWSANLPTVEEASILNPLLGTLVASIETHFDYLPSQERQKILRFVYGALIHGFILGKDPNGVFQVFVDTKPEVIHLEIPEWVDAYFTKGIDWAIETDAP